MGGQRWPWPLSASADTLLCHRLQPVDSVGDTKPTTSALQRGFSIPAGFIPSVGEALLKQAENTGSGANVLPPPAKAGGNGVGWSPQFDNDDPVLHK